MKDTRMKKGEKTPKPEESSGDDLFLTVGIGASAGGLKSLDLLFTSLSTLSNIAFVIIQHLSPSHKSIMDQLLKRCTPMPVRLIEDGMVVEPGQVYLNSPDHEVDIVNNTFHLMKPVKTRGMRFPIDYFFRSLAEAKREHAIGIILSGTGSDGTKGMEEIKGAGGMTMAQDEKEAEYGGMPESAIQTGLVDYVLPVENIAEELKRHSLHPYIEHIIPEEQEETLFKHTVQKVLIHLRNVTGHNFTHYKQNTIYRRLKRRMAIHKIEDISAYLHYLQETPQEAHNLFRDLLISVTSFFRNRDAFEGLKTKVLTPLIEKAEEHSTIRIWVPGCASGEEALSIAMLCADIMEQQNRHLNFQIFATDIDTDAIERARAAEYPENMAVDLPQGYLQRYFTKKNGSYRVKKDIREMVIYALQDLIKDPPFSRLHLISCRNLLIYLESDLQKKLFPLFHFSLLPEGCLFLGSSETTGSFSDLFSSIDVKSKLFRRKETMPSTPADYPPLNFTDMPAPELPRTLKPFAPSDTGIRERIEKIVLRDYGPPCLLVNNHYEVVYIHGDMDRYLSLPSGEPTFNIFKIAREGLKHKLSLLIHKSFKEKHSVLVDELKLHQDNNTHLFRLIVRSFAEHSSMNDLRLVVFEELPLFEDKTKQIQEPETDESSPRILTLQQELYATREYLQTTIEELETSNEELKSTNEELQSTNEELQSSSEEVETAKEELQSTNEELIAVNAELQMKVDELMQANDDINNLLASTEIGTIFLDNNLRIKRFTPTMTRLFNLIPHDVGRPLLDITSKITYKNLNEDANDVLTFLKTVEHEVQTTDERWFAMHIRPYRTRENVIDGVVITFVDITNRKKIEIELQVAKITAENILDVIEESFVVFDQKLRIIAANRAFHRYFTTSPSDVMNRSIDELGKRILKHSPLKELVEAAIPDRNSFEDREVEYQSQAGEKKKFLLKARRIAEKNQQPTLFLLSIREI